MRGKHGKFIRKTRKYYVYPEACGRKLQDDHHTNAITRQLADIDCNACILNSKGRSIFYALQDQ